MGGCCPLARAAVERGLRSSLPPMARSISTARTISGPVMSRDVAWWIASCSALGSRCMMACSMAKRASCCSPTSALVQVGDERRPGKKASMSSTTRGKEAALSAGCDTEGVERLSMASSMFSTGAVEPGLDGGSRGRAPGVPGAAAAGRMRPSPTPSLQSRSKVPGALPRRRTRAEIHCPEEALWYSTTSPSWTKWMLSGLTRSLQSRSYVPSAWLNLSV
mmetsp:Transcript_4825/g.14367  ORF Transcript_4825/g.14367 Transcript_4825/m.14367 type:complete len:220 (+) Transcript_4825:407-1066(+)